MSTVCSTPHSRICSRGISRITSTISSGIFGTRTSNMRFCDGRKSRLDDLRHWNVHSLFHDAFRGALLKNHLDHLNNLFQDPRNEHTHNLFDDTLQRTKLQTA